MTILTRLTILLALILHLSFVLGKPLHFNEVEKAWKRGLSDRDIHATAIATPSFFHEARSHLSQSHNAGHIQDFDSVLDERSLAANKAIVGKRGVVAAVQEFVELRVVGWMRGDEGEGDAPVLRPRRGRRWE